MHSSAVTPSLIFDLDGTLVDSLPGIADSLNRTLEAHDLPQHPLQAVRNFVGNGLRVLIERAAPEASGERLESIVTAFKKDYAHSWIDGTRPYPAITHLLKEFQRDGYQMAVLSNKTHEFTSNITRELFPLIHFTLVLGQQDGVPHKPHPAGALKIANAMGCNPKQCILIGDSMADAETADNAGMAFIGATWGYQDRQQLMQAGASHFADSPAELPRVIKSLELD